MKKLRNELKAFAKHCLLFQSQDIKELIFGLFAWFSIALFIYAVYGLINL